MNKNYLITGRAGIGKSDTCKELQKRHLAAYDGDSVEVENRRLAGWVDLATGQRVQLDSVANVDETQTDWLWDEHVLEEWLALPEEKFLCGSAGNDLEFFDKFAMVFVLTSDPFTHMIRLQTRESEYAKDPAMIQKKLAEQQLFVAKATELGAIAVSTLQPPKKVVDQILAHVR